MPGKAREFFLKEYHQEFRHIHLKESLQDCLKKSWQRSIFIHILFRKKKNPAVVSGASFFFQEIPKEIFRGVQTVILEGMLTRIPKRILTGISKAIVEGIPGEIPSRIPKASSGGIMNRISRGIPVQIPERIPHDLSRKSYHSGVFGDFR